MKIAFITIILILSNSYLYSQYYNKIIDVNIDAGEIVYEAENNEGKLYTRSINYREDGGPTFMRLSKFDEYGDLIATSPKFDNFLTGIYRRRETLIVGDSILVFKSSAQGLLEIQICNLNLDSLERKEYLIGDWDYLDFNILWYTVQNDESIFAVGFTRYTDEEPTGKRRKGMIARFDKETFALDTVVLYTRGTSNFEFSNPQIDENHRLSLSFIESDFDDGVNGNQYGVIKFDEDFNEIYHLEVPFHYINDPIVPHWELPNGNIVFADKGRDTSFTVPISSAAALHCMDIEGNELWRIEEYDSDFMIQDATRNYSDGVINQDGNLVVLSHDFSWLNTTELRLMCVSPIGEILWKRYFESPIPELAGSSHATMGMVQEENGDLIIYCSKDSDLVGSNLDHWLIKTDAYGCIEPGCQITAIERIELKDNYFNILQNPTSEIISLSLSENIQQEDSEIVLYNLRGKVIKREKVSRESSNMNFLIGNVANGMYLLQLQENGKILQTEKVIIQ
jgi:hypothetical protein